MKLLSLACCLPVMRPGSYQAMDQYQSVAWGLGTPDLLHELKALSHCRWQLNFVNSV